MKLKNWLIPAIGALALGFLAVPGQSAPAGGVTGDLKIAAGENAGVEKAHYRRYRHHRHYRHYSPGIYLYFGHRRHHRHHHHYRRW